MKKNWGLSQHHNTTHGDYTAHNLSWHGERGRIELDINLVEYNGKHMVKIKASDLVDVTVESVVNEEVA